MVQRRSYTTRVATSTVIVVEEPVFSARVKLTTLDRSTTRACEQVLHDEMLVVGATGLTAGCGHGFRTGRRTSISTSVEPRFKIGIIIDVCLSGHFL
jgi:hypothetical protein